MRKRFFAAALAAALLSGCAGRAPEPPAASSRAAEINSLTSLARPFCMASEIWHTMLIVVPIPFESPPVQSALRSLSGSRRPRRSRNFPGVTPVRFLKTLVK